MPSQMEKLVLGFSLAVIFKQCFKIEVFHI